MVTRPPRPRPWVRPFLVTAILCSLSYLGVHAIANGAVRVVAASDTATLAAVGKAIAYFLPVGAVTSTFLSATVPVLVASAGSFPGRRRFLVIGLRTAGGLSALSLLAGVVALCVLPPGPLRLLLAAQAIGSVAKLYCEVMYGYALGSGRPLKGALVQLSQALGIVTLLVVLSATAVEPVVVIAVALGVGPYVGLMVGCRLRLGDYTAADEPTDDASYRASCRRQWWAGGYSAAQGGLNMGLIAYLFGTVGALGETPAAALSWCYGAIYTVAYCPWVGMTSALLVFTARASGRGQGRRIARALALTSGLSAVAYAFIVGVLWAGRDWFTPAVAMESADAAEAFGVVGLALILFAIPDTLTNVFGYAITRGSGYFGLPVIPTAVGFVTFAVLAAGARDLREVMLSFLISQTTWSVLAVFGGIVVARRANGK